MIFEFVTLSNGKVVQALFEAEENQIQNEVGEFDFEELTNGNVVQKVAFVDIDGNKIKLF